jgi:predicted nucleic acid-binding protein
VDVVLDAGPAIALFRREPSGPAVARMLRENRARMCTVNAAETVDVLVRVHRWDAADVMAVVEQLLSTAVEPVLPSVELSTRAGELRARHFDRRGRLSLADCFALATAEEEGGSAILTTDRILADAARAEGIEVVLLDS